MYLVVSRRPGAGRRGASQDFRGKPLVFDTLGRRLRGGPASVIAACPPRLLRARRVNHYVGRDDGVGIRPPERRFAPRLPAPCLCLLPARCIS
jgi:hypothetical protein